VISDGRVAALLLLSKQMEQECREALRTTDGDERKEIETAVRNITSARKTLERVSANRLLLAASRS